MWFTIIFQKGFYAGNRNLLLGRRHISIWPIGKKDGNARANGNIFRVKT